MSIKKNILKYTLEKNLYSCNTNYVIGAKKCFLTTGFNHSQRQVTMNYKLIIQEAKKKNIFKY